MSLADHIRRQEESRQELERWLNDLGREFAVLIRDLGLDVIPVMDTTGIPPDYKESMKLKYRSDLKLTGTMAFPLFVRFHAASIFGFNPMCITPDGEVLLTEKVVHRQSLGGWQPGPGVEQVDIEDYVLIYSGAMARHRSWKEEREQAQRHILVTLSNVAHRNGSREIMEPVELAMLDVYNSAKRNK